MSPDVRETAEVSGPMSPRASKREQHGATHLPPQARRDYCVRGMSGEDARRSVSAHKKGVPTACLDYSLGERREDHLDAQVGRDGKRRAAFAHVASRKGGRG